MNSSSIHLILGKFRPHTLAFTWMFFHGQHVDAIGRTNWHAQFAPGTVISYHRMHVFGSTDDAINGAGLDAKLTPNAGTFFYFSNRTGLADAIIWIECHLGLSGERSECGYGKFSAGRALVDLGIVLKNSFRIVEATGIADDCTGCELCVPVCPTDCITMMLPVKKHPSKGKSMWPEFSQNQVDRARIHTNSKLKRRQKPIALQESSRNVPDRDKLKSEISKMINKKRSK